MGSLYERTALPLVVILENYSLAFQLPRLERRCSAKKSVEVPYFHRHPRATF